MRWMVREILEAGSHIRFDETAVTMWNIPVALIEETPMVREVTDSTLHEDEPSLGKGASDKYHAVSETELNSTASTSASPGTTLRRNASAPRPSSPIESSLDAEDAVQKMGNAFKKNPLWWILEIIPLYYEWQNEHGKWVGKWT
jgi:hypothetical protein